MSQQLKDRKTIVSKNGNGIAVEKRILEILSDHPVKIGELARTINKSRNTIVEAIVKLQKKGNYIVWDEGSKRYFLKRGLRTKFNAIPKTTLYTDKVLRKLDVSETHFGSRYSQPHFVAMSAAFIQSKEFGDIHIVAHYGDVCNGLKHADYSRGENILNTADLQIAAGVEVLDCFDTVDVFIKPGDHDMWQFTTVGLDMVKNIVRELNLKRQARGRKENFHYVSSDDGDQAVVNNFTLEFKHIMSAQSRGLTTKAQYMFEDRIGDFVKSLRGETGQKNIAQPDHIGCGNWHREISFFHGGTAIDLYPGFQSSTSWEKGMGIVHKFGAKIITLGKDTYGNIFRYDVRYLDFSDSIKPITKSDLDKALLELSLGFFRQMKMEKKSKQSKI